MWVMHVPAAAPSPSGVGVAVVFDWALVAQLLTQAVAASTGHLGLPRDGPVIGGRVVAAVLLLALGEGIRRGVSVLRVVQVVIMVLITALGVGSAAILVAGRGDRSLVFSTVVELTWAPWLAWRLTSGPTRAWFARVHGHGGGHRTTGWFWVAVLATWSAVWGAAVAWTQSL